MAIPIDTITATPNLFPLSLRFLFLTLEQNTPIIITVRILQDLNIMTMGKLTKIIAMFEVSEAVKTIMAQMMLLRAGMGVCVAGWGRNNKLYK